MMGTIVSLLVFVSGESVGDETLLTLRIVAIMMLLATWTFSALMIAFGAYMELKTDEQEQVLDEETEG